MLVSISRSKMAQLKRRSPNLPLAGLPSVTVGLPLVKQLQHHNHLHNPHSDSNLENLASAVASHLVSQPKQILTLNQR